MMKEDITGNKIPGKKLGQNIIGVAIFFGVKIVG